MAYDSVLVIAAAALEMEKRDRYRYDLKHQSKRAEYCQLDADNDLPPLAALSDVERNTPEFARMLADSIKRVSHRRNG